MPFSIRESRKCLQSHQQRRQREGEEEGGEEGVGHGVTEYCVSRQADPSHS